MLFVRLVPTQPQHAHGAKDIRSKIIQHVARRAGEVANCDRARDGGAGFEPARNAADGSGRDTTEAENGVAQLTRSRASVRIAWHAAWIGPDARRQRMTEEE